MRLSTLLTAALAASPAVADRVVIQQYWWLAKQYSMYFHTDFGSWTVRNTNNGCQDRPGPPGLDTLCMDHDGKRRGHFKFSHQNFKRCLRMDKEEWEDGGSGASWTTWTYVETPCIWRLSEDEGADAAVDAVSAALPVEGATTLETRLAAPTPA